MLKLACISKGHLGLTLVIWLLIPDFTTVECQCILTYATRQLRDSETEKRVNEFITNYTARKTDHLMKTTTPVFNLTSQLVNKLATEQSIPEFILSGKLYELLWDNFTAGYKGSFNETIAINYCNDTCNLTRVTLPEFLRLEYSNPIDAYIKRTAIKTLYPLGAYRPGAGRSYNYSNYNYSQNPPQAYSCTPTTGYAYRMRFSIDSTNLKEAYYTRYSDGRQMMTDLELAVDNFTSYTFGETYIQSNFDFWDTDRNTFYATLYFNSYYDPEWNTSMSDINQKLIGLEILKLKNLNFSLTSTSPPTATKCYWYSGGKSTACDFSTSQTQMVTTTSTLTSTQEPITRTFISTQGTTTSTLTGTRETLASVVTNTQGTMSSSLTSTRENFSTERPTFLTLLTMPSSARLTADTNLANGSLPTVLAVNKILTGVPPLQTTDKVSGLLDQGSLQFGQIFTIPSLNRQSESTATFPAVNNTTRVPTNTTLVTSSHETTRYSADTTKATVTSTINPSVMPAFGDDPLFKAVVPVIPNVYNDQILLKGIKETSPVSLQKQAYFYTITIPTAFGITVAIALILVFCQIDWIGMAASSKNNPK